MNDGPVWTFGDRLAKARREAGLTQSAIAVRLGRPKSSISAWESGVPPRNLLRVAAQWAEVTGVPVGWLLGVDGR